MWQQRSNNVVLLVLWAVRVQKYPPSRRQQVRQNSEGFRQTQPWRSFQELCIYFLHVYMKIQADYSQFCFSECNQIIVFIN